MAKNKILIYLLAVVFVGGTAFGAVYFFDKEEGDDFNEKETASEIEKSLESLEENSFDVETLSDENLGIEEEIDEEEEPNEGLSEDNNPTEQIEELLNGLEDLGDSELNGL